MTVVQNDRRGRTQGSTGPTAEKGTAQAGRNKTTHSRGEGGFAELAVPDAAGTGGSHTIAFREYTV